MEQGRHKRMEGCSYDAVPRDGPHIFVVDAVAWDRGEFAGAWVPADANGGLVLRHLSGVLRREVDIEDLAVVDQVGVETMVDEQYWWSEAASARSKE